MLFKRFVTGPLLTLGTIALVAACGGSVNLGSDANDLKKGAVDGGPAPDSGGSGSGSGALDGGPAPDSGKDHDGGPAPDSGSGTFACGGGTCNSLLEICEGMQGGIPLPDGGSPGISYSCSTLPAACVADPSCACVEAAVSGSPPIMSCSDTGGGVTIVRQGISAILAAMRLRRTVILAGSVSAIFATSQALADADDRADATRMALDWRAPEGCPTGEDVTREVARLVGERAASADVLTARAVVTREDDHRGFRVELATDWRGARGERTLEAHSCEELGGAVAVVLALTMEPSAAITASAPRPPPPPPSERADAGSPEAADRRVALGAGAVAHAGAQPGVAFAPRASVAVLPSLWRVELGLSYSPAKTSLVDSNRGGDFTLTAVDARACRLFGSRAVELGPCVLAEGGALSGRGVGIRLPGTGAAPWLAAGGGLLAGFRVLSSGALWVVATLEGEVSLARYRFEVDAVGLVYQPSPFAGGASLRGEARF